MENNNNRLPPPLSIEELHNMDLSGVDPEKKIYDKLVRVLGDAYNDPAHDVEAARNAEANQAGPSTMPPPPTTVEDDNELEYEEDPRSHQMSPALTKNIHPGYPYRENIGDNDDLPKTHYSCPYLAARVDAVSGDPRIRGLDKKGDIPYDEGTLTATPMEVIVNDIKDKVAYYPLGEDAYLDTNYLQVIGSIDNRGLAVEGLRLVQLQGEFRYLEQWQRRLKKREQAIHLEQGELIDKKRTAHTRQTEVYKRLHTAKAASRIVPRLIA
jgi:hypothetical protein